MNEAKRESIRRFNRRRRRADAHSEIVEAIADATVDELEIIHIFISKVMGEGRDEYGPLDLDSDMRTAEECIGETLDELADSGFWAIMALQKIRRLL